MIYQRILNIDDEEKIDIVEKSHRSKIILDSLRHKYLEGEKRSNFTGGMNLTYVEEKEVAKKIQTRNSSTADSGHPIKKYAINPKFRFKAAVRLVIIHLLWMSTSSDEKSTDKENFAAKVRLIRRKKGPLSLLTYHEKMILVKHPFMRTEEDIKSLAAAFSRIKRLKKLGSEVHMQLAKTAEFFCFGANREVMRRHAPATGIYLVTSGEVSILSEHMDPITLSYYFVPIGSIGPGEIFGEVSLIYDISRLCTIVTMATCEMVFWGRKRFQEILLQPFHDESNQMMQVLKQLSYFEDWEENALRVCSCKSYVGKYPKHSTIRAHGVGEKYFVHIMLKGECHLIHRLDMTHGMNKKGKPIIPYPYDGKALLPGHTVITHLFSIARFTRGMVFNLGESWKNRMALAYTDVVIFLIPIDLIEEYGAKNNTWEILKLFIKNQLPDEKKLYEEYCENIKLIKHREKILKNIYENKHA